jgi:hypothetical protein
MKGLNRMKTTVLIPLAFVLFAAADLTAQPSAAVWSGQEKEALAGICDDALADILRQGAPALEKLFAEVKTGGVSDPLAVTRIAALTQFVMRREGAQSRTAYADALLAAAKRAPEGDVACFFLDQLRWCGLPQQANALREMERSDKPGVAALAAMTVQAVTDDRASKAKPVTPTRCAQLNAEIAALKGKDRTARLFQLFADPDPAIAGVACDWARKDGGRRETERWAAKLDTTTDPLRKTMLLDLLANRNDRRAVGAVAERLCDADNGVALSAHRTLFRLSPSDYAEHLPGVLKTLQPERFVMVRDSARVVPTALLKPALLKAYDGFSDTGKKVAMELFKDRRVSEASRYAIATLNAADAEAAIASYRFLRETAGPDAADTLLQHLLASTGRITPEAQSAYAAAARRDTTGRYLEALTQILKSGTEAQTPLALETAARIGGDTLRQTVENAVADANADISTAAIRALAEWPEPAALPTLLRLAVNAPDAKRQTLAARGVAKLLNRDGLDKKPYADLWRTLRGQASEARRKEIDNLFAEEKNVARGKPVTTNVGTQGNNLPAHLVDGTLEKAWHGAKWPAQAQIDLGALHTLRSAHLTFFHDGRRTYTFTLELSEDGKTWKQVADNQAAPKPARPEGLSLSFAPTPARYVRLNVLKNSVNEAVHVLELKVFEAVFQ